MDKTTKKLPKSKTIAADHNGFVLVKKDAEDIRDAFGISHKRGDEISDAVIKGLKTYDNPNDSFQNVISTLPTENERILGTWYLANALMIGSFSLDDLNDDLDNGYGDDDDSLPDLES